MLRITCGILSTPLPLETCGYQIRTLFSWDFNVSPGNSLQGLFKKQGVLKRSWIEKGYAKRWCCRCTNHSAGYHGLPGHYSNFFDARASSFLTVKDWDTWLKSFNDGEQDRKDNGILVRAYGHDVSDNHKVRIVSALIDSAKAMAYYKSDAIKKRMSDGGVVGQPSRFFYHVVQRY